MSLKVSTGLRNAMLITGSLRSQLAAGFIHIYAGTPPASANDALDPSNTLLCTISASGGGTGINLENAAANGVVAKEPTETWQGTNLASGTATFFRFVGAADTGALSTTQPRLQGEVGLAGKELNISSVALTSGAVQTIDFFTVALPTP